MTKKTGPFVHRPLREHILVTLEAHGPMRAAEIAKILGAPLKAVMPCAAGMQKVGMLDRHKVDVPLEQRGPSAAKQQWAYAVRKPAQEPKHEARLVERPTPAPFVPLRGSGLYGRPIVLRPASDWALHRDGRVVTIPGDMPGSSRV